MNPYTKKIREIMSKMDVIGIFIEIDDEGKINFVYKTKTSVSDNFEILRALNETQNKLLAEIKFWLVDNKKAKKERNNSNK